jgi:hypothetical protein
MRELSNKLNEDVKKSLIQNRELVEQGEALLDAQERLATEVRMRTEKIQIQNSAIEQFIKYNTEALIKPQAKLKQVIETFQGDTDLHQFLKVSGEELTEVVNSIRETILSEENLNREKIRPHD